jgi:hypothetical protein
MTLSMTSGTFPSQVVSDLEKQNLDYGKEVGQAIAAEWFNNSSGSTSRFAYNQAIFHERRLYARGEQDIQKYKNELAINGDLSYLNLDWKPVPIIPKFVDIVVNGISDRSFKVKAYSQDPYGINKRSEYMESIIRDMHTKELNQFAAENFGVNLFENQPETLPETQEEIDLHMQISYKQGIEKAEEQAINTLFAESNYPLVKKRANYDLAVLGIGCEKNTFSPSKGVRVEYVDPANIVYSYTESPYFDDVYYVGEVKYVTVTELKKEFPDLDDTKLLEISKQFVRENSVATHSGYDSMDENTVPVLYYNYKTYMNEVYKVKDTATGATKVIIRDDQFDPPVEELEMKFGKMSRSLEVLYEGVMLLGSNEVLKWKMAKNMMRPKSNISRVKMNYSIVAPRSYRGRIESLVSRVTGFADMIQLTHLKIQEVLAKVVPDGVYLDADGLAEIDLGNGTNYNPAEALNMFFQTGSVVGRSLTQDGELNHGKIPIQELQSNSGGAKLQSLITTYNYYMQMIRDATGLNEARDGSTPDARALVGVQKIAAANSNTATRHILDASLYLTNDQAEGLSLRISDILEFAPDREAFIQKVGAHNIGTLDEMNDLHLHDFGISIELTPDDEEKTLLENNIQQALAQGSIELEDAIDVREIQNLKLANQLLKLRRKKKQERDQAMAERNIQVQAEANSQAQQAAAQTDIQKEQALVQAKIQLEQAKAGLKDQSMMNESELKKELMMLEFELNMKLKDREAEVYKQKESFKEDRKDDRTKIQASQQSELIEQRNNGTGPKNFESAGNDIMEGGISLGSFGPR